MTKKAIFSVLTFVIISITFTQCESGKYIINKGCIKDEFKIKFTDEGIELAPDKFFSTVDLKLKTNNYGMTDFSTSGYRKPGVTSYKITIERFSNHKTYYGRIAFFSVPNRPVYVNKAVASFYKIVIPENYFDEAKDGITSTVYEYYNYNPSVKFPTWMIWFSDVPL